MNENKLKEFLYTEQQKAMRNYDYARLNRINNIIYRIHCRQKARKELLKKQKYEKMLERIAEIQISKEL